VNLATWEELIDFHCHRTHVRVDGVLCWNRKYEPFSGRRYNFSTRKDNKVCRLLFLNPVLKDKSNSTLVREGRFIWCKDLEYKGLSENGLRQISFSVDKGKKRFTVEENNMLCIPSKSFVNNNKYFRSKEKVFKGFSSVLSYDSAINMMARWSKTTQQNICDQINRDNPFKPGTLVAPRLGYFYPMTANPHLEHPPLSETHPYGIILGKSFTNNSEIGREFYRVRFGTITYEAVHPVQMEIINEV
jgi:hypothetical protein